MDTISVGAASVFGDRMPAEDRTCHSTTMASGLIQRAAEECSARAAKPRWGRPVRGVAEVMVEVVIRFPICIVD